MVSSPSRPLGLRSPPCESLPPTRPRSSGSSGHGAPSPGGLSETPHPMAPAVAHGPLPGANGFPRQTLGATVPSCPLPSEPVPGGQDSSADRGPESRPRLPGTAALTPPWCPEPSKERTWVPTLPSAGPISERRPLCQDGSLATQCPLVPRPPGAARGRKAAISPRFPWRGAFRGDSDFQRAPPSSSPGLGLRSRGAGPGAPTPHWEAGRGRDTCRA